MNEEIGEFWFRDVFLKNCGTERPQLLLDGHSSHETLGLLELAVKGKYFCFGFPSPYNTLFATFGPCCVWAI